MIITVFLKRSVLFSALALAFLIACGDSGSSGKVKNSSPVQGGSDKVHADSSSGTGFNQAFVVATDFETGSFAVIDLDTRKAEIHPGVIHSDAVGRFYDNLVFVINRFGQDNIQILDPAAEFRTVAQYSTGNGSNPHDIEFVSPEKAYISLYEKPSLSIVNPMSGEMLGSVDLTGYAGADGIPEVDSLQLVGNTLYVTLGRLDRNNFFAPTRSSVILLIDVTTDSILGEIPVEMNPYTDYVSLPDGNLLLGSPGQFGMVDDGGINLIDTNANTGSVVLSELQLGGDISDVVMIDSSKGYAIVNDESYNTSIVSFDLNKRTKLSTILASDGFVISDLAVNSRKEVYVGWRQNGNPGVRIFDGLTDSEITSAPIDVGLPPQNILFLE